MLLLQPVVKVQGEQGEERGGERNRVGRPARVVRKESSPDPVFILILKGRALRVFPKLLSEATCEAQASWSPPCVLLSFLEAFGV